jgi:hypothetical protein
MEVENLRLCIDYSLNNFEKPLYHVNDERAGDYFDTENVPYIAIWFPICDNKGQDYEYLNPFDISFVIAHNHAGGYDVIVLIQNILDEDEGTFKYMVAKIKRNIISSFTREATEQIHQYIDQCVREFLIALTYNMSVLEDRGKYRYLSMEQIQNDDVHFGEPWYPDEQELVREIRYKLVAEKKTSEHIKEMIKERRERRKKNG